MIHFLFWLAFGLDTPKKKFIRNVIIMFLIVSFCFWLEYDYGEGLFETRILPQKTPEELHNFRVLAALRLYSFWLVITVLDFFRMKSKTRKLQQLEVAQIEAVNGPVTKATTKKEEKIDPSKAMFKQKNNFLERYIREV